MKKKIRKVTAMLLTCALLLSSQVMAGTAVSGVTTAVAVSASTSSDVTGHWAEKDFSVWYSKQLITGYADGTFKPDQEITRAEFIALINRVFNFVEEGDISFSDVAATNFAYSEIKKAVTAGYVNGYSDGTVRPNAPISRGEAAVILFRAFELQSDASGAGTLTDVAGLPEWSKSAVTTLVSDGYVSGYSNKTFKADNNITRAEALRMMNNISGEILTQEGVYAGVTARNVVINKANIELKNTVIEGDLYLTEGIVEGDVTLNNVTVKGRLLVSGGGENSIKINNSTIKIIIVNKKNGKIRVVTQGSTNVEQVFVVSGVKLEEENSADGSGFSSVVLDEKMSKNVVVQLKGSFDNVEVRAITAPELKLLGGIINKLVLQQKASIFVDENGEVKDLVILVDNQITVSGNGKISYSDPKTGGKIKREGKPSSTDGTNGTGGTTTDSTPSPSIVSVKQVTIEESKIDLLVGDEHSLNAVVTPSNASNKKVEWRSSNSAVTTVDENGKVTAVGAGTAVITATSKSNSSKSDSVTVNVTESETSFTNVSVHDPSIVVDEETGQFYVFGSHIEAAKSDDLMNWTTFTNGYATENNVLFGDLSDNLAGSFAWAGEDDADSKGGFSVWAPDVYYNPDYDNGKDEDGNDKPKGAYMMYYSTSSTYIRSAIGFAVSQDIEGPYTYVDTLINSGFTKEEAKDANSDVNKLWTNTNVDEVVKTKNDNWFNTNGSYNNNVYPNAIDATLFTDEDGKLWMVYGSWSGGIFVFEIDKANGQPIRPEQDGVTSDGRLIDRYFGTKIFGGYHQSGEGPFILYDENSGYYYLTITYGGLAANGGYNMRMFRATSPAGPYNDAEGKVPVFSATDTNSNFGVKLIGNYLFERNIGDPGSGDGIGYVSPGHNSLYIDEEGRYFNIFHSRFPNTGEIHEVRVHQMFLNEDGWPVVAPYRYTGEQLESVEEGNVVGEFKFVNHGKSNSAAITKAVTIQLNADHTVSGEVSGSWKLADDYYAEITIDNVVYNGVFVRLWDGASMRITMTFTAISDGGVSIWGSQVLVKSDEEVVQNIIADLDLGDIDHVTADLTLPTKGARNATISWETSDADVITSEGVITRPESNEEPATAVLTATVTKGALTASRDFGITVVPMSSAQLTANYTFDDSDLTEAEDRFEAGSITGNVIGSTGGTITYAEGVHGNAAVFDGNSGVALPNGLIKSNSYSVSLWVKPDALSTNAPAFFGAKDGDSWISLLPQGWDSTMLWSRNIDSNNAVTWYDALSGMSIGTGEWNHLAYTVESGAIKLYVNGVQKYSGENFHDIFTTENSTFTLGVNWWDPAFDGMMDDLLVYEGVLTAQEIKDLVFDKATKVSSINLAIEKKALSVGNTYTPTSITVLPVYAYNQEVNWSSSNPEIAEVNSETGEVTAVNAGTVTITATATDGDAANTSYTLYVVDGAVAYFDFEGHLQDAVTQRSGTVTGDLITKTTGGSISYDAGVNGQSAVFDGKSGVLLPDGLISSDTYSVSMSLFVETAGLHTTAFFGQTNAGWISFVPGGIAAEENTLLWESAVYRASTGMKIPVGEWVNVTFTVNNGKVTMYINGVQKYTGLGIADVFTTEDGKFALAVNQWDTPFKGKIDDLRIYDKELTEEEVAAITPNLTTETGESDNGTEEDTGTGTDADTDEGETTQPTT